MHVEGNVSFGLVWVLGGAWGTRGEAGQQWWAGKMIFVCARLADDEFICGEARAVCG